MSGKIIRREKVEMNPIFSPQYISPRIRPKIKTNQFCLFNFQNFQNQNKSKSVHAQQHVSCEFADYFA